MNNRIRWVMSIPSLIATLGLATSYAFRGTSAAAYTVLGSFDQWNIFPWLFGGAFVLMLMSLFARKWYAGTHVIGAALLAGYTIAVTYTALAQNALAGWTSASLALSVAVTSFIAAHYHARTS